VTRDRLLGQVVFARDEERALIVDDVVVRHTTLAARGLADAVARERIAPELGATRTLAVVA
jgi:hypothetical protein